jgi:5'-phosphate synthase pdxT subunit
LGEVGGVIHGVFIRAPRFVELGSEVEVLARHGDEPVLVRQGNVVAGTFHPELAGDGRLHRYCLDRWSDEGGIRRTA